MFLPDPTSFELTEESMKARLTKISELNNDKFISSGFPPRICTLIVEELCNKLRFASKVLDIGCGKGFVGEYLKACGFLHITGMDCSKSLLQVAKAKKVYEKLEKVVIG